MDTQGACAVVTGGASGIGQATALALARRGARVIVADIDPGSAEQTMALVSEAGGVAVFQHCDVTSTGQLESLYAAANRRFGAVGIAFNNAGVSDEDLFSDDERAWRRLIELDLTSVVNATRIAVREMRRAARGGVIINAGSLIGLEPYAHAPVYSAAKAGVVNFSRALGYLAAECGIRVNTICPEIVDTPMVRRAMSGPEMDQMLRAGILRASDVADAVLQLIDDDSRAGCALKVTLAGGREYA